MSIGRISCFPTWVADYIYIYILISIYESYDVAFLACEHQNFEEVAKEDV